MGNPRARLQTALNYLAQNVVEVGREGDVEVIVADWGSEIPLHTVTQLTLTASRLVSFVVIPPDLAGEVQKDSPFSEVHALNAAVRRAKGQYIGRIDQDTLVGKRFLQMFFEMCEGARSLDVPLDSALLFANRRSIPYRFASRDPSLWAVDRYLRWFGQYLKVENHLHKKNPRLFYCSYVGIWLLHRNLWEECGGYDERLIYMNEMESDMAARLMSKYKMVNLGELVDYDFYHLSHYHPRAVYQAAAHRKVNTKKGHEKGDTQPPPLHPNSEDWGLLRHPLEVMRCSAKNGRSKTSWGREILIERPIFILLLLAAGIQSLWDNRADLFHAIRQFSFSSAHDWRRRTRVAWGAVRGQHLFRWPRLLLRVWMERKLGSFSRRYN
jgi:hypothetical protein